MVYEALAALAASLVHVALCYAAPLDTERFAAEVSESPPCAQPPPGLPISFLDALGPPLVNLDPSHPEL